MEQIQQVQGPGGAAVLADREVVGVAECRLRRGVGPWLLSQCQKRYSQGRVNSLWGGKWSLEIMEGIPLSPPCSFIQSRTYG